MLNIRSSNNFDFIRLLAASLVVFSHSFPLVEGNELNEPLSMVTAGKLTLGYLAVMIFFVISGFLVSASWENRKNIYSFLRARMLRIFPGLFAMLLFTLLTVSFISTLEFDAYLSTGIRYWLSNLFLYMPQGKIETVFTNNPLTSTINGSLWTLRIEFTCYLIVGLFGVLSIFNRGAIWLLWLGSLLLTIYPILPTTFAAQFFPLMTWFASGMLAYLYKDQQAGKKLAWMILSIASLWLITSSALVLLSPLVAWLLIKIAYLESPFLHFGRYGDFSYGVYIYGFPIQQLVVYLMIKYSISLDWWICFLISFPITLILAAISWHLVEKRFLRRKTGHLQIS